MWWPVGDYAEVFPSELSRLLLDQRETLRRAVMTALLRTLRHQTDAGLCWAAWMFQRLGRSLGEPIGRR